MPFLFGREVDLRGRNLVRFMLIHLPLDDSVLISMLSCAPEVVGFGCLVGLFWKRYWFRAVAEDDRKFRYGGTIVIYYTEIKVHNKNIVQKYLK